MKWKVCRGKFQIKVSQKVQPWKNIWKETRLDGRDFECLGGGLVKASGKRGTFWGKPK